MTGSQNSPAEDGAPDRHHQSGPTHHQSRHKHHSRRMHESTTALYRGSSGKDKQKDEHDDDSGSSDGSFSESGSASCSTASDYSVEYSDAGENKHRHRHHRRSYAAGGSTSHSKQASGRRQSAQNLPTLLRGTASRRKQVFIDHPEASGDEESTGFAGSESPEDGHGRRRGSAMDGSSGSTDDNLIEDGDDGTNVRARQEALNTRHPFGLPIWKPALYKKSRSVTRAAFLALHARPLRSERLYLRPGNIAWMLLAGWWLMCV
ncbi:hypothetical protein EV175_005248, partial [Coemansia sp. RSA 1933]